MLKRKSKNKKFVKENFDAGKANMEVPDYEIKIDGVVPISYATAINDRQDRVEKIDKDFENKNEITNEFIDETQDRYMEKKGITESMEETKLYKRADKLAREIESFIQDITEINWEDFTTETDIDTLNKAVASLDGFATAYSYIMDNEDVFESKQDVEKIRAEYKRLAAKLEAEGKDIEKEKLEGPLHDLAMKYVDATIGSLKEDIDVCPVCKKNPCICECDELKEATTRNRSKNTKKEDKMYSTDDLWLQVYDDLSSEVENEGPKGEVNKQVDIPRGKRFVGPYAGPGDYDLTVYGKTMEDLQWAKKVADHYGVDIKIKKDMNRRTNTYYPYTAILKDIK